MKKIDYIVFSIEEFKNLGRIDALSDGTKEVENIVQSLSFNSKDVLEKKLKNYLLGYKLGLLERAFMSMGEIVEIDYDRKVLVTNSGENVTFEKGFDAILGESLEEARLSLMDRR